MAVSIKDLFTYKKEVSLLDRNEKEVAKCWVRLLGETDLNQALKSARIESMRKRQVYRDIESEEFRDEIQPLEELTREELTTMILSSKKNQITSQAFVHVNREELPKIEEISDEPDAPALEDQEKLDKQFVEQEKSYSDKIDDYVSTRLTEEEVRLTSLTDAEIIKEAQHEMSNILPFQAFYIALGAYKAYLGSFEDKNCTKRIFSSVSEFENQDSLLKSQLIEAYNSLEIGADDIKN